MIYATNLKCEYLTNPIGIDYINPRLSWTVEGAVSQSAYEIQAVDANNNIVWNSGKVASNQMHLIQWGTMGEGKDKVIPHNLVSRDYIAWQVRLWDENDEAGEYCDEATFELGLIDANDWKAKWITGNYTVNKKNRYPVDCFSKSFVIDSEKNVLKARAYMSACGLYEGKINGSKIGEFCLAPGYTDYKRRIQYQTVDITDQVKTGENNLEFMLADGWYRGSVGAWGRKNEYGIETKLLVQIEVTYEDGSVDYICTDDSWKWMNEGPVRFADNKDGEIYDAAREANLEPGVVNWVNAKITKYAITPTASNNFPLVENERFTNPSLYISPSGKKVLDFGQNIAGYIEFEFDAKAGEKLFLRFGEKIGEDGEFDQHNIQCVNKKITTPLQQIDYSAKDGHNHYKTRFAIFGFQFVELTGDLADKVVETSQCREGQISTDSFTSIAVYSGFERTFSFDSSNALLNKLVESTLWSLKNNSADVPTDCPTRERHGWTGDAQIFVNTASYMVNYAPFANKYENDLKDWQKPDGKLPQIVPEGGTDFYMKVMDGSVGWADAGVFIPYRIWKKYNDIDVIDRYYEVMSKFTKFAIGRMGKFQILISDNTGIKGKDKKYLYNMGQHYGEWAEPNDIHQTGFKDFMSANPEVATAYGQYLMEVMIDITTHLMEARAEGRLRQDQRRRDYEADLKLYREYAAGCKHTYQVLRSKEKYSLDTDRQASLVRPLYYNLLNEEQTKYARKRLIQALDNYKWRVGTGFLSTPLILYVLQDIDLEYAYKLLENEDKPGWLFMPKSGATTIWEDWEGPTSDNGVGGGIASLNHYSKGAVCEWIFDEMCGIKMDGDNHFIIAPHPGGHFTYANMTYDSVHGKVYSGWEKTGDRTYKYHIELPANTTATIILRNGVKQEVPAGKYEF
ncbi:MAG: family 78 glycoside hydrolase catalytic domain [Lachnospiraceae bacterium]|nr:family 78 glycoside hydrolase catalytic domain [Lachnospiraceae bacterium]